MYVLRILEMKRALVHRNRVVAMASKKRWKKYLGKLNKGKPHAK